MTGILLLALHAGFAQAQAVDPALLQSLTPEQREQVLKNLSGASGPEEAAAAPEAARDVPQPLPPPAPPAGPDTPAEQLKPFGYDLFQGEAASFAPVTEIPVPHDYVLGPGDILKVQMFGNEVGTHTLTVSRDGAINFPKLGPIEAAGLRFDAFRELIEKRVANEMIGVKVNVSLGRLRSIRVFVVGDAARPGSYTISSLSTMTNALVLSGGVGPMGSLRDIQLKRKGRLVARLDLYDLLLRGDSSRDARLMPGDVLFIPPVGKRVTVAGQVKRPAIYEMKDETTVGQMLALAGGVQPAAATGVAELERYQGGAQKALLRLDVSGEQGLAVSLQDGDILHVPSIPERVENRVDIVGHVRFPGKYPWREGLQLGELLQAAQPLPSSAEDELYYPLALVERSAPETGLRSWQTLNLRGALEGQQADALLPNDRILIFTRKDIEFLSSQAVRGILLGQARAEEVQIERIARLGGGGAEPRDADPASNLGAGRAQSPGKTATAAPEHKEPPAATAVAENGLCEPLIELARIFNSQRTDRFAGMTASLQNDAGFEVRETAACPEIYRAAPSALPFLMEQAVAVVGEVRRPGLYPVNGHNSIEEAVALAGGLTPDSDPANIELVSYSAAAGSSRSQYETLALGSPEAASRPARPGDLLRVKAYYIAQERGTVEARGEFRLPGRYNIVKGESLSQLIARAGGLTEDAYPFGAVFTRESARRTEEQSFRRAADELQNALVTAVTSGAIRNEAASAVPAIGEVIRQLRTEKAVGRVVVEANPDRLRDDSELDLPLEPGDRIFIPKKPNTVTVIGQVLNPGSVSYNPRYNVADYIKLAGSYTQASDEDRVFLVLPNGTAQHVSLSFWGGGAEIPPGSTIVVPRDATPINPLVLTERVIAIFRDLALSAAALVTITSR